MAFRGSRPELYRWKRRAKTADAKPRFENDTVAHWVKKVEQASEFAVSEAFALKDSRFPQKPPSFVADLETSEQLQDHDGTYAEAQELLHDWLDSKLTPELMRDSEATGDPVLCPGRLPETTSLLQFNTLEESYDYLENGEESTTVPQFIQHLLHKEVVNSGILGDLDLTDHQKKQKDPRLSMELRHQQVRENRLRHQKELERQRAEAALRKAALAEAQALVRAEQRRRALAAKQEEEEVQREMVKLRRELAAQRHTVEEAWKVERERLQREKEQVAAEKPLDQNVPAALRQPEEERDKESGGETLDPLMAQGVRDHQTLRQHFSAWFQLVRDRRIQMGKAGALADWQCRLRALRAWRDYAWAQRLQREIHNLETLLREQNRKQQLAVANHRNSILRRCFTAWQCWSRAEAGKRELELRKEETKRKMAAFLEALSLGLLSSSGSRGVSGACKGTDPRDLHARPEQGTDGPLPTHEPKAAGACLDGPDWGSEGQIHSPALHRGPTRTWPASPLATPLCSPGLIPVQSQEEAPRLAASHGDHGHPTGQLRHPSPDPGPGCHPETREKARLWATAVLVAPKRPGPNPGAGRPRRGSQQMTEHANSLRAPSLEREGLRQDPHSCFARSRGSPKQLACSHPILKAMEERAVRRAERRRELEDRKKKQEEENLALAKAREEERQRQEVEAKRIQRAEKRLLKLKELEKQRRLQQYQRLQAKAKEHYDKTLLRTRGLDPWKALMLKSKENMEAAQTHWRRACQRSCLNTWHRHVQLSRAQLTAQADDFHSQVLLRKTFSIWVQYQRDRAALAATASQLRAAFLKKKVLGAWSVLVRDKHQAAVLHSDWRMLRNAFRQWRRLPESMQEERLREERREQLRRRVAEILPDFRA
ncbi:coiled-coil domain-containing protein 191 isoform X2 [Tachyglossus aculeatus]|uniref:coiled-coil domain-containing protein 191 isoform X2 n=1 Tax=Tachyglossus aculeatus TaxID=9261 RepID=UPI0018F2C3B7|nr:coiled-coil domain-containing protein 191 isoform X2 [Tachyglossus aculeatus]